MQSSISLTMLAAKTYRDQIADLGWWDPDIQEKGRQGRMVVKREEELMRKGYLHELLFELGGAAS